MSVEALAQNAVQIFALLDLPFASVCCHGLASGWLLCQNLGKPGRQDRFGGKLPPTDERWGKLTSVVIARERMRKFTNSWESMPEIDMASHVAASNGDKWHLVGKRGRGQMLFWRPMRTYSLCDGMFV